MLLQTNSYIVPAERRADHARLIRRFRQAMSRIGCDQFEVYEQVGPNWSPGSSGRYVQIMRFRDRQHQQAVQAAERNDPGSQQIIAEFCDLINFPYQQQHGYFATSFYASVLPVGPRQLLEFPQDAVEETAAVDEVPPAVEEGEYQQVDEQAEVAEDVGDVAGEEAAVGGAAVEGAKLAAGALGELPAAELDELPATETDELAPIESDELPATETEELAPLESDELSALETDELAPIESDELPAAETGELAPVESDEFHAVEGDELAPAEVEDELTPIGLDEFPVAETDGLTPAELEELPAAETNELAPAEPDELAATEAHLLTPAEAAEHAAIAAGEMLPDDAEAPPAVDEDNEGNASLEVHDVDEEAIEGEVVVTEDSSFASFIDSLTQEDLQAHENVVQESPSRPRGGETAENVSEANFADGAIPAELENDLVTADAFSPAEPAPEDEIDAEAESSLPVAGDEESAELESPATLESLDETGDSLVDRLGGLEAEHLVDDPAHDRAALLHDEFDPERALAEDLGLEFEVEPSAGNGGHLADESHAADAATGKEEPMIEFETFLRELENPAADPGRRSH